MLPQLFNTSVDKIWHAAAAKSRNLIVCKIILDFWLAKCISCEGVVLTWTWKREFESSLLHKVAHNILQWHKNASTKIYSIKWQEIA